MNCKCCGKEIRGKVTHWSNRIAQEHGYCLVPCMFKGMGSEATWNLLSKGGKDGKRKTLDSV